MRAELHNIRDTLYIIYNTWLFRYRLLRHPYYMRTPHDDMIQDPCRMRVSLVMFAVRPHTSHVHPFRARAAGGGGGVDGVVLTLITLISFSTPIYAIHTATFYAPLVR